MLTTEEITTIASLLSKLEPGVLPQSIFDQFVRLVVTPTVEMVPLRRRENGIIEVLLTKREDTDPIWPGMYHIPGTVIRSTDKKLSFDDAFERIIHGEINGIEVVHQPVFVQHLFHQVQRGAEVAMIHWMEVEGEIPGAMYADVTKLPENILAHHPPIIALAVQHFSATLHL